MKKIYLDNAATTQVDPLVLKSMIPYFSEKYGNASSVHSLGEESKKILEDSRKVIAKTINAKLKEIIFTSGGTEGNNLALKGLYFNLGKQGKNHIITTKIEHDSILKTCKWLEKQGAKITYLNVDKDGFIDLNELRKNIGKNTLVVSIIHGNNEIGVLQDLETIGEICREKNVLFHVDACQSYMKEKIDVKKFNIGLLTLNAHKIHGPKGVGALYIKDGITIEPILHGGGHEFEKRSGTENIPGIVGFTEAVRIFSFNDVKKMESLRDKLIKNLLDKIPGLKLNGSFEKGLCNNVNIYIKGVDGETLQSYLDARGIYVSTGSACAENSNEVSHVLRAIGLNDKEARSCIRISLSKFNTEKEIDFFVKKIVEIVGILRKT